MTVMKNIVVSVWIVIIVASGLIAQETALQPFKIKDQFDQEYTEKGFLGKISIVIGSDKNGSKYNSGWGRAISDSLRRYEGSEIIQFIALADLRGVPFFLKGFVRGKFPKEKEKWALMDWKGHFAKTYNFQKKTTNILLFDTQGYLVHKTFGWDVDSVKVQFIIKKLSGILERTEKIPQE